MYIHLGSNRLNTTIHVLKRQNKNFKIQQQKNLFFSHFVPPPPSCYPHFKIYNIANIIKTLKNVLTLEHPPFKILFILLSLRGQDFSFKNCAPEIALTHLKG